MIDMVIDIVFTSLIRECEMITYTIRDSIIDINILGRTLRITLKHVPVSFTPEDNDEIAQEIMEFIATRNMRSGIIAGIGNILSSHGFEYDIALI